MKIIRAMLRMGCGAEYVIHRDDLADAAYERLRASMATYKEFGNDRELTVEIELDHGKATIRLAELASVTIDTMYDPDSEEFIERLTAETLLRVARERLLRDARAEAGLPADERAS